MNEIGIIAMLLYGTLLWTTISLLSDKSTRIKEIYAEPRITWPLLIASVLLMALSGIQGDGRPFNLALALIGAALLAVGYSIFCWALWTLGANWVPAIGIRHNHKLAYKGPYKFVRHPMYSSLLVATVGIGVMSLNILLLLSMMCFSGAYLVRSFVEENVLGRTLGDEYREYCSKTPRFIPRLGSFIPKR